MSERRSSEVSGGGREEVESAKERSRRVRVWCSMCEESAECAVISL